MASWVSEEKPLVKPNWMGPSTMRAEEGGGVGLAQDGHGGGPGVEAGLARPHPHPVPAPAVGQQRLLQRAVVVAAALVAGAACPVARHGAAQRKPDSRSPAQPAARLDLFPLLLGCDLRGGRKGEDDVNVRRLPPGSVERGSVFLLFFGKSGE